MHTQLLGTILDFQRWKYQAHYIMDELVPGADILSPTRQRDNVFNSWVEKLGGQHSSSKKYVMF